MNDVMVGNMIKKADYRSEYNALKNAIHRCHTTKNKQYGSYGGRGIEVCSAWRESHSGFWAFLSHIGTKPSPELTLDRINNDGNYEPGNVRWATRKQQQQNRRPYSRRKSPPRRRNGRQRVNGTERRTLLFTHGGHTLDVHEWSEKLGLQVTTICWRYRQGWKVDDILSTKLNRRIKGRLNI